MKQTFIRCLEDNEYWTVDGFRKLWEDSTNDYETFESFCDAAIGGNGLCDKITIEVNEDTVFQMLFDDDLWVAVTKEEMLQAWADCISVAVKNKSEIFPTAYITKMFNID